NGESWCEYQSKVGNSDLGNSFLDFLGNFWGSELGGIIGGGRGRDTPGSQHFRASCQDGEIHFEQCGDYRNEVCVQGAIEKEGGGEFTSASCRVNRWQECLNYNPTQEDDEGEILSKIKTEVAMSQCSQDPDCFVKDIKIDDGFEFPVCAPKYPPGFDMLLNPKGAEQICGFASQTCTAVFVKEAKAFGAGGIEWECVANCDCVDGDTPEDAKPSQKFVEEMNNFCVSLGDCGSSVNYVGDFPGGKGYDVRTDAQGDGIFGVLSTLVNIDSLFGFDIADVIVNPSDADAVEDFAIIEDSNATLESVGDSLDDSLIGFFDLVGDVFGFDLDLEDNQGGSPPVGNNPQPNIDDGSAFLTSIGYVTGLGGIGMMGLAHAGLLPTSVATFGVASESGTVIASGLSKSGALAQIGKGPGSLIGPQYTGVGGAFMGATMAAVVVSMAIQFTGIGPGLGSAQVAALTGVGATGGGMIGYSQIIAHNLASATTTLADAATTLSLTQGTALAGPSTQAYNAAAAAYANAANTASSTTYLGPAGIVILAVAIITIIVLKILGVGEIKEVNVQFECKPWVAPLGGENCELCGSEDAGGLNDDLPCSRYACQSLGQSCAFVEQDPESVCVDLNPGDVSPPEVVELNQSVLIADYGYEGITDSGFNFRRSGENECMSQYESAIFGIETDEFARCRLGKLGTDDFNLMSDFGSGDYLKRDHLFNVPAQEILQLVEGYEDERVEVNLFLKCLDARGNINEVSNYAINFCVEPIDLAAPIALVEGGYNSVVRNDVELHDLSILLFEDAECKLSEQDVSYEEMSEDFYCASFREREGFSPRCLIEDVSLELGDNELFLRCKDHPEWAGTNKSEERNVNEISWDVNIFRTEEPLNVSIIEPHGFIVAGTQIVSQEIIAETSGGIENGKAVCEYSVDGGRFSIMENTGETEHSQIFDFFFDGIHNLTVRCTDYIGNPASDESEFEVEKDLVAPKVTRVYDDFGTLVVVSDEPASCSFVNEKPDELTDYCGFDLEEGEEMEGQLLEHKTNFDRTKTYYVRCEDIFENKLPGCGIIVKGAEF
ncbi:MAG: hypothetical protein KC506_00325, partial [Nanoarchaeota archaeon]|nr:hypothetical protein [Nanoarchaeota archaeon]